MQLHLYSLRDSQLFLKYAVAAAKRTLSLQGVPKSRERDVMSAIATYLQIFECLVAPQIVKLLVASSRLPGRTFVNRKSIRESPEI